MGLPARFGIKLSGLVALVPGAPELAELVRSLEQVGAEDAVIGEHLLSAADMAHPGGASLATRRSPTRSHTGLDTLVLLAVLCARTDHIRLGSAVLIGGLHEPVLLAKQAASLDVLSRGRFDLGLAGGWYQSEFDAVGAPFEHRFKLLEEHVRVCQALWRDDVASFAGRWTSFDDMTCSPAPFTPGGPPVWLGGSTAPSARRVAELASGWVASEAAGRDAVARTIELVHDACGAIGRDPSTLGYRASIPRPEEGSEPTVEESVERISALAAALVAVGVDHVTVPIREYGRTIDGVRALVAALAAS
jgi:probable F420-dependent oxidoreductase